MRRLYDGLCSIRDHFLSAGFNIYDVLLYTASFVYFPQHLDKRADSLTSLEDSSDQYWLTLIGMGAVCTVISNQIIYRMRVGGYFSGEKPMLPSLSKGKLYGLYATVVVSILFKANAAATSAYAKIRDIAHSSDENDITPLMIYFFSLAGNILAQTVVQAEYLGMFEGRGFASAKSASVVAHFFIFFYSLSNTLLGINSTNRNFNLLYDKPNLISWNSDDKVLAGSLCGSFILAGVGMHLVYSQKSRAALTRDKSEMDAGPSKSKRMLGFCAGAIRTFVMFTNAMGLLSKTPDQNGHFYLSESSAYWVASFCAPGLMVCNFSILFERKPSKESKLSESRRASFSFSEEDSRKFRAWAEGYTPIQDFPPING